MEYMVTVCLNSGSARHALSISGFLAFSMLRTLLYIAPLYMTAWSFPTLQPRQNTTGSDVDCAPNSRSGLKAECWEALNLEQYINDWVKANGTEAKCNEVGFAQCFLQFNVRIGFALVLHPRPQANAG